MAERLQKVLARHGLGSRREIESWMRAGRVLLNGQPAPPGAPYEPGDRVRIDGRDVTRRLKHEAAPVVLAYHKPVGEALSRTPDDDAPVSSDRLPATRGARWIPINRMALGDSGLVLLTNDGRLAHALMRRTGEIAAVYLVRVHVNDAAIDLNALSTEVEFDGVRVAFAAIEPLGGSDTNRWLRVSAPGADRRAAVRALFESQGLEVSRVTQVRFADVELPRDLPRGRHRALSADITAALYELAGLDLPEVPVTKQRTARHRKATRTSGRKKGRKMRASTRRPA